MTISSAVNAELTDALALLFGQSTATESQIAHAFRLIARGDLNPDDVLVARTDGNVCGAVFCQRLAGSLAVIWPARSADDDAAMEDMLTASALEHVSGAKIVQAFLGSDQPDRARSLLHAGFRHVTRVLEMRLSAAIRRRSVLRLQLKSYSSVDSFEFRDVLLRAHEDSLDCPELQGLRAPDEILAGYLECAAEQEQWRLAYLGDEPVGVLLMHNDELTFIGIVPERRKMGIGRALIEAAIEISPQLSLIVDARNAPAVQLYSSVGFAIVGAREVFLKSFF